MQNEYYKTPRLFYPQGLCIGENIILEGAAHHYLRNVMRKEAGAVIRIFNSASGEFAARIKDIHKKYLTLEIFERLTPPLKTNKNTPRIVLLFPPLPKDRNDILIEKAVELGVHELQPVICEHSSVRKLKEDRIEAQIIEAAEQCERLDIPSLHSIIPLTAALREARFPIITALERRDAQYMSDILTTVSRADKIGYLIGPEGGFSDSERSLLDSVPNVLPCTLGSRILRAETAAFYGLSIIQENLMH